MPSPQCTNSDWIALNLLATPPLEHCGSAAPCGALRRPAVRCADLRRRGRSAQAQAGDAGAHRTHEAVPENGWRSPEAREKMESHSSRASCPPQENADGTGRPRGPPAGPPPGSCVLGNMDREFRNAADRPSGLGNRRAPSSPPPPEVAGPVRETGQGSGRRHPSAWESLTCRCRSTAARCLCPPRWSARRSSRSSNAASRPYRISVSSASTRATSQHGSSCDTSPAKAMNTTVRRGAGPAWRRPHVGRRAAHRTRPSPAGRRGVRRGVS
jgi:hypothetical protein